jgi:hypothetical protein
MRTDPTVLKIQEDLTADSTTLAGTSVGLRATVAQAAVSGAAKLPWLPGLLRRAAGVAGVLYIGAYLLVALLRMTYPFDIEIMDGNFLIQVGRVLAGQPLYVAPTLEYAPMVYAPVYFYVSAWLTKLAGFGYTPMRLLSILSSIGCFAVLYRFVSRETSSRFCGLVSAGLFAATYRETGYCFDLARADSTYLFLAVLGAYLLRWRRDAASLVLAGLCLALSFFTKQTAVLIAVPLMVYAATVGPRAFAAFAGTAGGLIAAGIALLHVRSGGWSSFYLFSVISGVFTVWNQVVLFWARDVFLVLPIAASLCLLYFLDAASGPGRRSAIFYGCLGAGMAAASWLYSLNWGAGPNGRIPIYFFLCLTMGLGISRALNLLGERSDNRNFVGESLLFGMLLIQFGALLYNPLQVIPRQRDVAAGRQLVDEIAKIPGAVYVPYHPYLAVMAGKQSLAHMMNLRFLLMAPNRQATEPLRAELRESLRQKRFSAVIVDADWNQEIIDDVYREDLLANYTKSKEISYAAKSVLRGTSGLMVRPQFVYVPKAAPEGRSFR